MFGCKSLGKESGKSKLPPGAPVGRSMPVASGGFTGMTDDVRRLCEGMPSVER